MTSRKIILLILSPLLLVVAIAAILVGLIYVGGADPALSISNTLDTDVVEVRQLAQYTTRCLLVPLQLVFAGLVFAAALAIYRRRWSISTRAIGSLATIDTTPEPQGQSEPGRDDRDLLVKIRPQRRLTLTHITASLIAAVALAVAFILILGQFVNLTDLAIVFTALTSALAWGARLPVSDALGGISNLIENNFNVGDRLSYRHHRIEVEGVVERVNLRYTWLRATSGEQIILPFGEIRTLRNFSRSTFAGVYVSVPIPSSYLEPAIQELERLAPESTALIPDLLEPWRIVSQDGFLGPSVELSLYGRAGVGHEQELQLAMHELIWARLQAAGLVAALEDVNK